MMAARLARFMLVQTVLALSTAIVFLYVLRRTDEDQKFGSRIGTGSIIWHELGLAHAIAFCIITGVITFVDARLTTHVAFRARNYPFGYWMSRASPAIFILTYLSYTRLRSFYARLFIPSGVLLAFGALSLPFFLPECPHTRFHPSRLLWF